MSEIKWYPSLLAADPLHLADGLKKIEQAQIHQVHLDIMDGHFVPNITLGPAIVAAVRKYSPQLFRDVHLMLSQPENFIPTFIENGAQNIFIHVEIAPKSLEKSIELLQKYDISWGFAINPETPTDQLQHYSMLLKETPKLLVMSVHPGFCGQSFVPNTWDRVQQLRQAFPTLELCLDGGVDDTIARRFMAVGVSNFVAGSHFFTSTEP